MLRKGAYINQLGVVFLILLASLAVACGSTRPAKVIDGAWNATLQNPDSTSAYTFSTILNQVHRSGSIRLCRWSAL